MESTLLAGGKSKKNGQGFARNSYSKHGRIKLCPSKTENFAHSGRETAQKRLRNGWSNGRGLVKVTASASPRCGYQSWGVSLSLKLVVVRTTSWREGVSSAGRECCRIAAVFTPVSTLYLDQKRRRSCVTIKQVNSIFFYEDGRISTRSVFK